MCLSVKMEMWSTDYLHRWLLASGTETFANQTGTGNLAASAENRRASDQAVAADDVAKLQTILQRLWDIRTVLIVGNFPSGARACTAKVNKATGKRNNKKAQRKNG